jgi:hypothetical protein
MLDKAEYDKQYNEAAAALEAAANPTTATPETKPEPVAAEVVADPVVVEETKPAETEKAEPNPLDEVKAQLEKTQKALKDTQAWGTKNAQRLADLEREANERQRLAERPAILDANPELEAAIKYVAPPVKAPEPNQWDIRNQIINAAHPGIFNASVDPELVNSIAARFEALGDDINDPIACIREITAEKLAYTERQVGKRFAAESAKLAAKSAMGVPGAGAGSGVKNAIPDSTQAEVNRIQNMTDAEFQKEVRKVKGY